MRSLSTLAKALLLGAAATAAACSSGGSGSSPTVVPPPPAPTPPPPTPPPPTNFRTQEYNRNQGLEQINVVPAYELGATGAGVIVSIIDTGIDVNNPEFAGRIDPRSADLVVAGVVAPGDARSPSLQDIDGHGTSVASIIGSAKNDLGVHGVAPQATLLVFRADKTGDPDTILGAAISEGVTRSASFGARVLNFSLGSDEAGAEAQFRQIFGNTASNDIVVAIAAGNDQLASPEASAMAATSAQAAGTVIIVGAVNSASNIASFSNRAGTAADFYMVAPGVLIPTTNNNGSATSLVNFSGTSAATPFVVGAAALIRELWPQLTAAEVVSILFESATDLGDPGVDPIYGRGLLNVGAAVQPLGNSTTGSVTGASVQAATLSAAGGGAFGVSRVDLGDYVFLDGYGRDFRGSLNDLAGRGPDLRFSAASYLRPHAAFASAGRPLGAGYAMLRMREDDRALIDPMAQARAAAWQDPFDARRYDYRFSAAFAQPLGATLTLHAAQGFSPREVDGFMLGREPLRTLGRDGFADAFMPAREEATTAALSWRAGAGLSLDAAAAHAGAETYDTEHLIDGYRETLPGVAETGLRIGARYALSGGAVRVDAGVRHETGGVLGARFGGVFGDAVSGTTYYHAASTDMALAGGWRVAARYAIGVTAINGGGGLMADSRGIISTQFAAGAYRRDVFAGGDALRLSVAQPLRVDSGALNIVAPTDYDYRSGAFLFDERRVAVGGGPREIDFEAGYALGGAFAGKVEAALLHQINATPEGRGATAAIVRAGWGF